MVLVLDLNFRKDVASAKCLNANYFDNNGLRAYNIDGEARNCIVYVVGI